MDGAMKRVGRTLALGVSLALVALGAGSTSSATVTRGATVTTLTADYQLRNVRASSVGSPPALTDIGPGTNTFRTESVDGINRRVLRFPIDNGVQLSPTTGVVPNSRYSIVVLARLDLVDNYRRLVDFKNGTTDDGPYVSEGGLTFYPTISGPPIIAADQYAQFVLTRNAAGLVSGYIDGAWQWSFDDSAGGLGVIDANNVLRFFRDNDTGGADFEESSGAVARIRLYDDALSEAEVGALNREPPLLELPAEGFAGSPVQADGYGFSPGERVNFTFIDRTGAAHTNTPLGSAVADSLGNVSKSVTIPASASTAPIDRIRAKGRESGMIVTKKITVHT